MFHEYYEIKSCFGGKQKVNIFRSIRCSNNVGHHCMSMNAVYQVQDNFEMFTFSFRLSYSQAANVLGINV